MGVGGGVGGGAVSLYSGGEGRSGAPVGRSGDSSCGVCVREGMVGWWWRQEGGGGEIL